MNDKLLKLLNQILNSAISDKTWLAEQKSIYENAKALKQKITGVNDDEVKYKK